MKKSIIIILLLVISAAIGFGWDYLYGQYELRTHPMEYRDIINEYTSEYGVPEEIVYSVINNESSFRIDAESHAGAIGLMQITPDTFDWLKMKTGEKLDVGMLYDPKINIKYGILFLSILHAEFNDWELSFAAYNAGLNRVKYDWLLNEEYIKDGKIVKLPFEETDNYVKRVTKDVPVYKRLLRDHPYTTSGINTLYIGTESET